MKKGIVLMITAAVAALLFTSCEHNPYRNNWRYLYNLKDGRIGYNTIGYYSNSQTAITPYDEDAFDGARIVLDTVVGTRNGLYEHHLVFDRELGLIDEEAFKDCKDIQEIYLPDVVDEIEESAFEGSGLTNIEFSSESMIAHIRYNAFRDCPLKSAIFYCDNVPELEEDEDEPMFPEGCQILVSKNHIYFYRNYWSQYKKRIQAIDMTDSIDNVMHLSFASTYDMKPANEDALDATLLSIDQDKESQSESDVCYMFDNVLSEIGDNAFDGCSNLVGIEVNDNVKRIGKNAFASSGLTRITIPKDLREIGAGAFINTPMQQIRFNNILPPTLDAPSSTFPTSNKDFKIIVPRLHITAYQQAWPDLAQYITSNVPDFETKNWMSNLPDNTPVWKITIPGTHDSGTSTCYSGFNDQNYDLEDQFDLGIRSFDLRPGLHYEHPTTLYIRHNLSQSHWKFTDALGVLIQKIIDNPTEFIVCFVGVEVADNYFRPIDIPWQSFDDPNAYPMTQSDVEKVVREKEAACGHEVAVRGLPSNLYLGDVRGKVLFLFTDDRYGTFTYGALFRNNTLYPEGIKGSGEIPMLEQNKYDLGIWKWDQFISMDETCQPKVDAFKENSKQFAEACRNGQETWNKSNLSCYFNFYIAKKSIPMVSETAEHINKLIYDYLNSSEAPSEPWGILPMDFAGDSDYTGDDLITS